MVVVMRGGMTAEQTRLRFGHPDQVRQFRQLFQDEISERLTDRVEEVTGRRVLTYQSQVMFDPKSSWRCSCSTTLGQAARSGRPPPDSSKARSEERRQARPPSTSRRSLAAEMRTPV